MRTKMLRWTAGRRALVVALVVTLTVLWQWASWSGDRALSILYIVSALTYVVGAVIGSVVLSRWIWRHRALVIVRSLPVIAGRGIWQSDVQVEVQTPWLDRAEAWALLARAYPEVAGLVAERRGPV